MAIKHRDVFYDYVDRCYNCRFCGKWWGYDEPEPDCMTGHEKTISLLDSVKAKINERKIKPGGNV